MKQGKICVECAYFDDCENVRFADDEACEFFDEEETAKAESITNK